MLGILATLTWAVLGVGGVISIGLYWARHPEFDPEDTHPCPTDTR